VTEGFSAWNGVFVAALGGMAVGLERQWSGHAIGPSARFAGLRTFTLLGMVAGLAGWLWRAGYEGFALLVATTAAALVVMAYWAASRHEVEATTEMAAVVVLAAGLLAGLGMPRVASGIFAVTALLLAEKSQLHGWVARLDDVGLRAGLRFGVMAIVVLPLLPEGPIGGLEIRPRAIWELVLFFSGVSFAGFVARRFVGSNRGYWVTGMLGGLVSSTNVTLTFARLSRLDRAAGRALATGALAANAVLFPRVWFATAVLKPELAMQLWWWLAAPFAVAVVAALAAARRSGRGSSPMADIKNPLQIGAALQMALLFQVVLIVVHAAGRAWGNLGVYATAALLGATDVDALTVSMSRSDGLAVDLAARAIAVGILANTLVKCGIALSIGSGAYRTLAASALAAMCLAGAFSMWWLGLPVT
jgi:uncharacterized membrane protein (DUF4010 family)